MTLPATFGALERIELPGVSSPERSVVATTEGTGGIPAVFVHGIFENVWKWLTPAEADTFGISLPDHRLSAPRFSFAEREGLPIQISQPMDEAGLTARLAAEKLPAVAYSYQDLANPIANMDRAVECLHRVTVFAMQRWQCERVQLVGHSRGGLVCRHALLRDSNVLSAANFRSHVYRLTTIATPHAGSRVADGIDAIDRAIANFEQFRSHAFSTVPFLATALGGEPWEPLRRLRQIIATTALLTPNSAEVREAATAGMPAITGGYAAVAGNSTVYFRCDVPLLRSFKFPPNFPIPELTDGKGDMAVAVESALDIPGRSESNTAIIGVNHFTNTFDTRVHDAVVAWLR